MYVIWTIVYLPLAVFGFTNSGKGLVHSILLYIRGFLFIGEQYNSWHLWYILSTVYAAVYIFVLLKFRFSSNKLFVASIFVFFIHIGIDFLSTCNGSSIIIIDLLAKVIKLSISSGRILSGLFFIPIGMVLTKKKPNLIVSSIMLVAGFCLNVIYDNIYLDSFFSTISSVGLFCIINSIDLPESKAYPFIRKMSTVIYYIHMYVWTFYYLIIYGNKTFGMDCFLVTTAICIVVAATIVAMMNIKRNRI